MYLVLALWKTELPDHNAPIYSVYSSLNSLNGTELKTKSNGNLNVRM